MQGKLEDLLIREEETVWNVTELDLNALPNARIRWLSCLSSPSSLISIIRITRVSLRDPSHLRLAVATNGLGEHISIPIIVAKGRFAGPVVGITAAIHGNELNGIPLIWRLLRELDVQVR